MYTVFRVKMIFMGGIKEMAGAGREIFFSKCSIVYWVTHNRSAPMPK
jgi:hypothetical protein